MSTQDAARVSSLQHPVASAPRVLVSIVNWNTPEHTLRCVHSLAQSSYAASQVVVVDNASRDDSVARIEANGARLLRNPENLGFAAGHEAALQVARSEGADAIWLLNSDTVVEPDALEELVRAWQSRGDGIYGALPLRRDSHGADWIDIPQKCLDIDAVLRPLQRDRDIAFDAGWRARAPLRVGAVPGACMLLPLRIVQVHGWLDTRWFMYCEELDYCWRLRGAGVPSWLVPRARVWHSGSGSQQGRPGVARVMAYYHARNQVELARRYSGRTTMGVVATKKLLRALLALPVDAKRARWLLRGCCDGLRGLMGRRHAPDDYL